MLDSNYYKVGGSLRYGHPTYIIRNADIELYTALKQKEFCYVLNSRQMGKSSLRVRTMKTLVKEGFKCAAIDLGILGRFTNSSQWYGGLVSELWRRLRITTGVNDDVSWWRKRDELAPVHRFSQFIEDILLINLTADIVIFLDEVDNIISLDFRDEFLSVIRNCYEKRAEYPEYNRLTFCLLGVATPSTLRIDKQTTPFNIGRAIQLQGFTLTEAQPLIPGLMEKVAKPEAVLAEILRWTKGQPFLTQKLCYLIVRYAESKHPNIQQIVQDRLIDNWELQDEPEHLKTIRDRLLYNHNNKARLLGLYQQILQQQGITADNSDEQVELRLSGLVVKQYGKLNVSNPIYQQVFNDLWVEKQLAVISPYQVAIATWLKSHRQDTSRLLRGQALEEGQAWAKKHSISAQEREFLSASEQLAKQERIQAELAQRTQAVEMQLAQERKVARWQRLFFLSLILLISSMWGITAIYSRKANLSELKTLTQSSQALYASHQKLDALIVALKAKKQLQRLIKVDKNLEKEVDRTLQQVVYEVKEYNRLLGHSDLVYSVAVSPDGNLIASAGTDRTVRLWKQNNTGWQQTQILDDHDGWVVDVAISSDGNTIASASRDRTIKLWDKNGKLLTTLTGHQQPVTTVAISQTPLNPPYKEGSNYIIVSGSEDGVIKIWQPGKLTKTLLGHTDVIQAIAISQDGKLIVSGSEDKTIKIWNKDGKLIKTFTGHTEGVRAIVLSPDETKIVSGSRDKTLKIWDINGTEVTTLKSHLAPVYGVAIRPDGQQIISASADNTIKIWDMRGREIATLRGHTNRVWDVAYSPDGNSIISASWDKTVRLWKPNNNLVKTFSGHQDVAIALDYSPQFIASASDDKTVKLWQHDGTLISTFAGHTAEVYDVAIHPSEEVIVSAGADKTIKVWQDDGTILKTFLGHTAPIWAVDISPDGTKIISGSNDNTIKIWDIRGNLLHTLTGHQKKVWDVAINPQGDRLVSGSEDNTIKIWDLNGKLLHTLKGHTDAVRTVAYSPDGNWIASGSEDRTVKLWNQSGKHLATLTGHNAAVKGIAISPDNQWIASADDNGKILLWRTQAVPGNPDRDQTWHHVHTLQGHNNSIWSVAFSPDGKVLVTAGEDSTLISWNLAKILQLDPLIYGSNWVRNYLQQEKNKN